MIEAFCGGALESVAQLCHLAARDGRRVVVLHGIRPETPENFSQKFPSGTRFLRWNCERSLALRADLCALRGLRKTVREENPCLIHAHSSKAGALTRAAFPFGALPVLYSPRGYAYLQQDFSGAMRGAFRMVEFVLGQLPHKTVACGYDEGRLSVVPDRNLTVIPNALDPRPLELLAEQTQTLPRTVVGAGRMAASKNVPLFLEIAESFRDEDIQFIWVGGPLSEGTRIPDNMTVTGFVSREECLNIIASGALFLQVSLWEGLPRAVLEAMAMAVPVVALSAPGSTELVADGMGGALCHSKEDIVAKIAELLAAPESLALMGRAGQQKISRNYSSEIVDAQWSELYRAQAR